jgi:hypothetical protein
MADMQVYTMIDKDQRDRLFAEMRKSDDPKERQAVRFSGNEPTGETNVIFYKISGSGYSKKRVETVYLDDNGSKKIKVSYIKSLSKGPKPQVRPVYRSIWSVAHPS